MSAMRPLAEVLPIPMAPFGQYSRMHYGAHSELIVRQRQEIICKGSTGMTEPELVLLEDFESAIRERAAVE
jgi:hypothetical protein